VLIAPFLIAFGLDDSFLVARAKDNANFIKGSLKAIELLRDHYTVNIISTSYQLPAVCSLHHVPCRIPHNNTYCTSFPIDDSILSMGPIEIDSEDEIEENTVECIRQMNHFFWELLINTGFSRVMQEVKPVGGVRKFEAVVQALEQEGLELNRSATIGDSITDWNMLKKTREAGGLALSFNGNEYAVSNCNVAVMSENCMVTALLVDVFPHAVWVIQDNIEETIEVSKRYRRSIRGTQIGVLG
jgi:energy-converting hydrogenase A subunit R